MKLAIAVVLALSGVPADDKQDLSKAVQKFVGAASYAFKGETKMDSPLGNLPQQVPALEGSWEKEMGLRATLGDRGEFFRQGDKFFVKQAGGEWQRLEDAQAPPAEGARPRGGRGFMQRMVRNLKAPHEEVQDVSKGFKALKKEEKREAVGEKECTVYGGELTEEGVKDSPLGKMLGQFGGAANATLSGSAKAWVDGEGNLLKYEVSNRASLEFQGNPIEFSLVRTTSLTDVGKARVEVPDGVKKLLEDAPKEKPKTETPGKDEKK